VVGVAVGVTLAVDFAVAVAVLLGVTLAVAVAVHWGRCGRCGGAVGVPPVWVAVGVAVPFAVGL